MTPEFFQFVPEPEATIEVFTVHQLAYDFRREVKYRQDFQQYCQWYHETAQQHQQELNKMRGDLNIFGWFLNRV